MGTQEIVRLAIQEAGGLNKLARRMGVAPMSVAQWRDGRALPEWFRTNKLSEVSRIALDAVQDALTADQRKRSEQRGRGSGPSIQKDLRLPLSKAGLTGAGRLVRQHA